MHLSEKYILAYKQMKNNQEQLFYVTHYNGLNEGPDDVLHPIKDMDKFQPYSFTTKKKAQEALKQVKGNPYFSLDAGCEDVDKNTARKNLKIGSVTQLIVV
ncbi:MAG TPA: hypothetical protein VGF14_03240 [Alphaproteobacteria bacterium]